MRSNFRHGINKQAYYFCYHWIAMDGFGFQSGLDISNLELDLNWMLGFFSPWILICISILIYS